MAYVKTTWVNKKTKLNASNMNNIEAGIIESKDAAIDASELAEDAIELANTKEDKIDDLETIRTGAARGSTAVQPSALNDYRKASAQDVIDDRQDADIANKQNIISDLTTIRNGAALGATALQEHQSLAEYRKSAAQDIIDLGKQPVISDLSDIRRGAELGMTALQEHQSLSEYRKAEMQDFIDDTIRTQVNQKQDKLTAGNNIILNGSNISAIDTVYSAGDGIQLNNTEISVNSDIARKTDLEPKADLPDKLPPELKAEDVEYPWFMINMEPKGIDASGNLHLVHSGYNFNEKQYYTWPEKIIPMAATESSGGVLTAADKIKLNSAITEHQDISGKADKAALAVHTENTNIHVTADQKSTWNSKQDNISDLTTIRSGATLGSTSIQPNDNISKLINDAGYLTQHQDISGKANVGDSYTKAESDAKYLTEHQDISGKANQSDLVSHTSNSVIHVTSAEKLVWDSKQDKIEDLATIKAGAALGATSIQSHQDISGKADKTYVDTEIAKKQDVIDDLDVIRDGANLGASALQEHQSLAAYRTSSEQDTIDDGLKDRISNLEARGRFLSAWKSTTGKPETDPTDLPYKYKSGDYYIVSEVGTTNYKPNGDQYTGVASTTKETNTVDVNDFYTYDGTNWILLNNTQKALTFSQITGTVRDNVPLKTELETLESSIATKQDKLTAGSNISIDTNNKISAVDATYTTGTGLSMTNNIISVDSTIATKSLYEPSDPEVPTEDISGYILNSSGFGVKHFPLSEGEADKESRIEPGLISIGSVEDNGTHYSEYSGSGVIFGNYQTGHSFSISADSTGDIAKPIITLDNGTAQTEISVADLAEKPWVQTNYQQKLTAGSNIQLNNNVISATDTTYTAGSNVSISNGVISATDTTYSEASTSSSGLMSASDKVKLNGVASGASAVSVSASGTATDEVGYITVNGVEKKLAGGSSIVPEIKILSSQIIPGEEITVEITTGQAAIIENTNFAVIKMDLTDLEYPVMYFKKLMQGSSTIILTDDNVDNRYSGIIRFMYTVSNKQMSAKFYTYANQDEFDELDETVETLSATVSGHTSQISVKYTKPESGIPASDIASGVIPTVPTNISAFTNDVGYLTSHQSLANYSTTSQMNAAIADHHDSTKQDKLTNGSGIEIFENEISIAAGRGLTFTALGELKINTSESIGTSSSGKLGVIKADDSLLIVNDDTESGIKVNTNIIQSKLTAGTGINISTDNIVSVKTNELSYNDLLNKPTNVSSFTNDAGYLTSHQSLSAYSTTAQMNTAISTAVSTKQDILTQSTGINIDTDKNISVKIDGNTIKTNTDGNLYADVNGINSIAIFEATYQNMSGIISITLSNSKQIKDVYASTILKPTYIFAKAQSSAYSTLILSTKAMTASTYLCILTTPEVASSAVSYSYWSANGADTSTATQITMATQSFTPPANIYYADITDTETLTITLRNGIRVMNIYQSALSKPTYIYIPTTASSEMPALQLTAKVIGASVIGLQGTIPNFTAAGALTGETHYTYYNSSAASSGVTSLTLSTKDVEF